MICAYWFVQGVLLIAPIADSDDRSQRNEWGTTRTEHICEGKDISLSCNFSDVPTYMFRALYVSRQTPTPVNIYTFQNNMSRKSFERAVIEDATKIYGTVNITIGNVSKEDEGEYHSVVLLYGGQILQQVTTVKVYTECPLEEDYFQPRIWISSIIEDSMINLVSYNTIELPLRSSVLLGLAIPKASPPVTCSRIYKEGSSCTQVRIGGGGSYCETRCHFKGPSFNSSVIMTLKFIAFRYSTNSVTLRERMADTLTGTATATIYEDIETVSDLSGSSNRRGNEVYNNSSKFSPWIVILICVVVIETTLITTVIIVKYSNRKCVKKRKEEHTLPEDQRSINVENSDLGQRE